MSKVKQQTHSHLKNLAYLRVIQIDLINLTVEVAEDNQGKRVIILKDANGQFQYKRHLCEESKSIENH